MSLMSPVSCISDTSYFYRVVSFLVCYILCLQTNQICSMTILMNLGMTPDPKVRTLFFCVMTSLLVVLVFWGLAFFTNRSWFQRQYFCVWRFRTNRSWVQKLFTHQNVFAINFLILFPNFKTSFIVTVVFRLFLAHSNQCSFTKNMIRWAPKGTILRPSDSGSRGTDTTALIQWCNVHDTQINKLRCLSLDGICRKVHTTARV